MCNLEKIYWAFTASLLFISNKIILTNSLRIQAIIFSLATLKYLNREVFFMALTILYFIMKDTFGFNFSMLAEIFAFICIAIRLYTLPELVSKAFKSDNIALAFYKGSNNSVKMKFLGLLDFPVTSVCIVFSDKIFKIHNSRYEIIDINNVDINHYYILDTNIKATNDFKFLVNKLNNTKAKDSWFKTNCITMIKPLLAQLGDEYVPETLLEHAPSVYLRKVLKIKGD